jgi:hypothetical protein
MGQAKKRGTREERIAQAAELIPPEQFFGYSKERKPDESPFEMSTDNLVCMVSSITKINIEAVLQECGSEFNLGDWFCSTGAHENTAVHGPFKTAEEAFEFGRLEVGAVRFINSPQWSF